MSLTIEQKVISHKKKVFLKYSVISVDQYTTMKQISAKISDFNVSQVNSTLIPSASSVDLHCRRSWSPEQRLTHLGHLVEVHVFDPNQKTNSFFIPGPEYDTCFDTMYVVL